MKNAVSFTRKLSLIAVLVLAVLLFRTPHIAYAHFPASDGDIDAILHVEPDDYPAPGSPQTLYLILSDVTGHFKLANCDCSLSISQQNKFLLYAPLTPPPANQPTVYSTSGLAFTFPAPGTYRIVATGRPLSKGAFQPFNLTWNFQVGQPVKSSGDFSSHTFFVYFGAIVGILIIIGLLVFYLT